jgi:hypothetical protein
MFGCGGSGETASEPAPQAEPAESAGGERPLPAPAQPGVDIEALFAREQAPQSVHLIGTPDGAVKARIEATTTPTVSIEEGFVAITAPNGPGEIQCFAYPERKDTADVLRILIDGTLVKGAPNHRWVDVHGDQVAGWPYVVARAHYLVDSPNGKMAGDFKVAASARGEATVACLYDAPGHYASFERVVRSLLESLDTAQNRELAKPLEAEITRTRLPGRMVSLSLDETHKKDGAEVVVNYDMTFTIGPEGKLDTNDDASTETFRKGRLESGTYAQSKLGQLEFALELTSKKDLYSVKGTLQDKPFNTEFSVAGGLPDGTRGDALVCDVHRGKKPNAELLGYLPGADPSGPTPMRFEKSPDPASHLRMTLGREQALVMDATVDDKCDLLKGTLRAGEVAIEVERIWIDAKKGK